MFGWSFKPFKLYVVTKLRMRLSKLNIRLFNIWLLRVPVHTIPLVDIYLYMFLSFSLVQLLY